MKLAARRGAPAAPAWQPGWSLGWSTGYGPVRRPRSAAEDRWRRWIVLPALVAVFQVLGSTGAQHGQAGARPLDVAGYALLLLGPAALPLMRRWPVAALVVAEVATLGYALAGYAWGPSFVALVVAVLGTARCGRWAAVRIALAAGYLAYASLAWASLAGWLPHVAAGTVHAHAGVPDTVAVGGWLLLLLAIVEANRVRWRYREEMVRITDERARAREEQERREAIQERLRIARELHDVLGHHLSLISVQAGVGLHLMDERPEQARDALVAIRAASAEALREVRGVLSALRPVEESAPRSPAPSLDNLDALVADAGFDVRVRVVGDHRPLPPEVDRAGYRIVQEALTNVRRHAGPDPHALVRIGYGPDELSLTVEDDGRGSGATGSGATGSAGNGIPGMRERAAALGGTLSAGPRAGGGFTVAARLPVAVQP